MAKEVNTIFILSNILDKAARTRDIDKTIRFIEQYIDKLKELREESNG